MKTIALTREMFALVDDEDYPDLCGHQWHANVRNGITYAETWIRSPDGRRRMLMHRLLLKLAPGQITDHADGNGLNNTRSNLRIATRPENARNQRGKSGTVSRFKGVCKCPTTGRWRARIVVNQKSIWLGRFSTEWEAASAYNFAATKYFGDFARLNGPMGKPRYAA